MPHLPPFPTHLCPARLDWRDGTPRARDFDDVYFSLDGGPAETRHVFLDGNQLSQRFADPTLTQRVIGETGFGTGLNFLVTAQEFLRLAPSTAYLHFVSVEKFPLTLADLEHAHALWPELATLARELRAAWPEAATGFHYRLLHQGRIRLTLLLGDADALLPRLNARVDAWFLDGFAPAKNNDLWTPALFAELARLSAPNATFSTFTAAGDVKRGLQAAGFRVEKAPGFGRKRDMLRGQFLGHASTAVSADTAQQTSQRQAQRTPATRTQKPRTAAVIGGGLAGCAAARALAERGIVVTLYEKNARIADETSGNLAGAVYPKFSVYETAQNRWYRDSYLFALARLPQILGTPDGIRWNVCGLLQLPDQEGTNLAEIAGSHRWPASVLRHVDAQEAAALIGLTELADAAGMHAGLWFPGAAWVNPPSLCEALVAHPNITVRTNSKVGDLQHDGEKPLCDGKPYDSVVIANALAAAEFPLIASLSLRRVRGQVSHIAVNENSRALKAIVCHDGYCTPARDGIHSVGATFGPRDRDPAVREHEHHENLAKLALACSPLHTVLGGTHAQVIGGRTGFRTQTQDYLPLIGPVADEAAFASVQSSDDTPVLPGLFILTALGAKGLAFSLLGAEIIASYACHEPLPVDTDVATALSPTRYHRYATMRTLRKNA